jgi:DNA-binding transcriptional ArsR family regulator
VIVPDRCDLLCLDLPLAERIRGEIERSPAAPAVSRAQALADPTRFSVAQALHAGVELCGCDLAWVTGRSQPLVSHHVKVLRQAGLVAARRDGRVVFFALTPAGRVLLDALLAGEEVAA